MFRILYILLYILIDVATSSAQPFPLFQHFTPAQGLPSSQVYQVVQDKDGYLWIATDHGVARYNGYEFRTFTTADGLKDNTIFKIHCDESGKIWMQVSNGELFYFSENKIKPYAYNAKIASLIKNTIPLDFFPDTLGNLYFAGSWIGEFKIDTAGVVTPIFTYAATRDYNRLFFDEVNTNAFIAAANGLYIKSPPAWFIIRSNNRIDSVALPANSYGQVSAYRTKNNTLLLSVANNLYRFTNGRLSKLLELPSTITNLHEDDSDRLWICTYKGLHIYSGTGYSKHEHYLQKDFLSSIMQDHEGGYWITTVNNGIYYLNNDNIRNYTFEEEPLCLTAYDSLVYAGFWNGRLAEISTSDHKTVYTSPNGAYINNLLADPRNGRVYLAKENPGYYINNKFTVLQNKELRQLKGNFILRKNGDIYNASINHIFRIENDSIFILSPLTQRANCIYETNDERILLGSYMGAFVFNEADKRTTALHPKLAGIRIDDIKSIGNVIFLATRGNGLLMLRGDSITAITVKQGLCSNILHRLHASENTIWCCSFNGLSRITFNDSNCTSYIIDNISISEGLPGNEINDVLVKNGTAWVAGKTGISFFNAKADFRNSSSPAVRFTALKINNKNTAIAGNLMLPYNSNTLSIDFEAVSFKSARRIIYTCILSNEHDSFRSSSSSRQVQFLSLKPGHYKLSVSAVNGSGVSSSQPALMFFTIAKPYWQQWWFLLLIATAGGTLIYGIVKQRIARIRKEEALKTDFNKQLVSLEIKALRSQMNPHFIFNVMNSIQDYILKNDSKSAQKYLTKFARLVRLILDNSINEEIVLQDELKAAALYVELEQQRFDNKFEFITEVDGIDTTSVIIPSMIIQPYLENAIKHGIAHLPGFGKLLLQITRRDDNVLIAIEDNGVGRKAAAAWNDRNVREHISHGSMITAKRIAAYNIAHNTNICTNIFDLENESGISGTRVEVLIPVKYNTDFLPD